MVIQKSSDNYLKTIPIPAAKTIRAKYNQVDLDVDLAKKLKKPTIPPYHLLMPKLEEYFKN